ncbi:DegV family protein [Erysipelothrix anatis]|uniref:DegV family protein n=1 Tax=Erysipelothrix anatis TaxID=2683713 RepID=UPI00135ACCC1|nr:DegV family protein [Erysipelothrix anatis]
MKNYAIVCDTSVSLTPEQAAAMNVTITPLTLIHNNKEYLDQVEMGYDAVNDLLRNKEHLQTSQPNLGLLITTFETLKAQNYDHIFVLALTSSLSGTYNSMNQAIQEVGLDNVSLVDTRSLAGAVQHLVRFVNEQAAVNSSVEAILSGIDAMIPKITSFVYPQTLDQLKISGRISKSAATLASLLKVKPILYLKSDLDTIEKFGTARTETKVFDIIIKAMRDDNVTPKTHVIYYLDNEGEEIVARANTAITEALGTFETHASKLPAVVAAHAGLGTIAIQWAPKF